MLMKTNNATKAVGLSKIGKPIPPNSNLVVSRDCGN